MNPDEFKSLSLVSVPSLVRFSPTRKARSLRLAQAAAEVLTELGLCNSNLAARFAADPESFVILLGDLTPQGLAFARTGFQRWLRNTDRWRTDPPADKFRSALHRQWGTSAQAAR